MSLQWQCKEWSWYIPTQWISHGYDEDLDEVQAYIQHEKGLSLQKIPMTDRCDRLNTMGGMEEMTMMTQ